MDTHLSHLTLVLAIGALAVAGYGVWQKRDAPSDAHGRIDGLAARLARLEAASVVARTRAADGPALRGRPADRAASSGTQCAERRDTQPQDHEVHTRIEALVEDSVARKAAAMQVMRDKKPSIDVFAKALALTDEQRWSVEREVLHGQRALYALLAIPTEDDSVLLDDLVDVLAQGIAHPDQASPHWARFLGRILTETIPGTNETYAMRAEAIKASVRETLRRDLSEEQYATFEAWELDPTEIQQIDGSPWDALEPRVLLRARALGAELPDAP